jgi:peptidoglycan/xylan/chitin deacetylase (PgdA/CDA1 family)
MRLIVKRAVELGLCGSGLPNLLRHFRRRDVLVLAYHNVVPDDGDIRGDRSLHIGQEQFHRHLSQLLKTHQVVALDDITQESAGRPRVVITFDDAYRGAVQLGVDVLKEFDAPATIFVPPGCLGGQRFWWDVLASGAEVEPATREVALSELMGQTEAILAWANLPSDHGQAPPYCTTATESELDTALGFDGLTVGSHTWSHPNLAALEEPELQEELIRPLEWLCERYPLRTARWLSYPYGLWSLAAARIARSAGYKGAFRIEGGWTTKNQDRFRLPRLNVPAGISLRGLHLRSSGLRSGSS